MYSFAFVSVKHAHIGLLVNWLIVRITKQWNIKTTDIKIVYLKYSINSSATTYITNGKSARSTFPPHIMSPTCFISGGSLAILSDMAAAMTVPAAASTTSWKT